jgi:hypothetical protein
MSHHHYEDVIDPQTGKTYKEIQENKKTMAHHYDDGPSLGEMKRSIHPSSKEAIQKKQEEIKRLEKEKEDLIKEEEVKNKKAYALAFQLKSLREEEARISREIIKVKNLLNKYCTHEKFTTREDNYPGGYLDRAEYVETDICDWCGETIDRRVSYGGFG